MAWQRLARDLEELAAGAGRSGPVGEATAYLFDVRGLVEHAVGWIERNFAFRGSTDLR